MQEENTAVKSKRDEERLLASTGSASRSASPSMS